MKAVFKIFSFLVLISAVVGGVILVQKNQETRRGAAASETSSSILPTAISATVGQNFEAQVWLNTGKETDKLSGVEFLVIYDPAKVKYIGSEPQNGFSVLNEVIDDGKGTLTLKMVTLGTEKGGAVNVLKITFKSVVGSGSLVVQKGKVLVGGAIWEVSSNSPSNYSVAGGATAVPTVALGGGGEPTAIPTTAPITGNDFVLNYKVAFANVNPNSAKCAVKYPLSVKVSANGQEKSYVGVMPTTREAVGNKLVFGGSLNLTGFTKSNGVSVFISGPKQLAMKYGKDKQVSSFDQVDGELALDKTTNLVYDFSGYPLIGGDVVSSGDQTKQDGVINGVDFAYIKSKSLIHETVAEGGFLKGDLDGNCQVNSNDINIIKMSLQEKQDQLY